jgi:hypothetical protein
MPCRKHLRFARALVTFARVDPALTVVAQFIASITPALLRLCPPSTRPVSQEPWSAGGRIPDKPRDLCNREGESPMDVQGKR